MLRQTTERVYSSITRMLGDAPTERRPEPAGRATSGSGIDPAVVGELKEIADYITRLKSGIASLRAQELMRDRLPMAHDELGSVVAATAGATNSIMEAAEAILVIEDATLDGYRAKVESRIYEIFEACTFQDITGQRISKVVEALGQLEKRLESFATTVKIQDGEAKLDPEDAKRQSRAETLMLNGPQLKGPATPQDAIDALFS